MRNLFFALVVAATGCAHGVDIDPEITDPGQNKEVSTEPALPPIAFSLPLDDYPELLQPGTVAAARWSAATGRSVVLDAGGIPIIVLDEVIDSQGRPTRERTTTMWVDGVLVTHEIEYRADSLDQAGRILLHAFGHGLGGYGHSSSGVMKRAPGNAEVIDAASLELVCINLECLDFRPEE